MILYVETIDPCLKVNILTHNDIPVSFCVSQKKRKNNITFLLVFCNLGQIMFFKKQGDYGIYPSKIPYWCKKDLHEKKTICFRQ